MLGSFRIVVLAILLAAAPARAALQCTHLAQHIFLNVDMPAKANSPQEWEDLRVRFDPPIRNAKWLPASLLDEASQHEDLEKHADANAKILSATVDHLKKHGNVFDILAEDSGPSSFSLGNFRGPTPLGRLAEQLSTYGIDKMLLSSSASTGDRSDLNRNRRFTLRLPLEIADLQMNALDPLKNAILEAYDTQMERILRNAMYTPHTTAKPQDSVPFSPSYSLMMEELKRIYKARRQRRFLRTPSENQKEGQAEMGLLHWMGQACEKLGLDRHNPEQHREFAEVLVIYLNSTGLPAELKANDDGHSFDVVLKKTSEKEWKKIYNDNPPGLLTRQFPELLRRSNQLRARGELMGWNTEEWLVKKDFYGMKDGKKFFYLYLKDFFRETPSFQTQVLIQHVLKRDQRKSMNMVGKNTLPDNTPLGEGFSEKPLLKDLLEEARFDLRSLLSLRFSYLRTDLVDIAHDKIEDMQDIIDVLQKQNLVQEEHYRRIQNLLNEKLSEKSRTTSWQDPYPDFTVQSWNFSQDRKTVFLRLSKGKMVYRLYIEDSDLADRIPKNPSDIQKFFKNEIYRKMLSMGDYLENVRDLLESGRKLIQETNDILESFAEDSVSNRDHLIYRERDLKAGAAIFILKASFQPSTVEKNYDTSNYTLLLKGAIQDFSDGKADLSTTYDYLNDHFYGPQPTQNLEYKLDVWLTVLENQVHKNPDKVKTILLDMIDHRISPDALLRSLSLFLDLETTVQERRRVSGVLIEYFGKWNSSPVQEPLIPELASLWIRIDREVAEDQLRHDFLDLKNIGVAIQNQIFSPLLIDAVKNRLKSNEVLQTEEWQYLMMLPEAAKEPLRSKIFLWAKSISKSSEIMNFWDALAHSPIRLFSSEQNQIIIQYDSAAKNGWVADPVRLANAFKLTNPTHYKTRTLLLAELNKYIFETGALDNPERLRHPYFTSGTVIVEFLRQSIQTHSKDTYSNLKKNFSSNRSKLFAGNESVGLSHEQLLEIYTLLSLSAQRR